MFSNRLVLFYAAALSFLLVPSCSKQSDDGEGSGKGGGTFSTSNSIFAGGSGNTDGNGTAASANQTTGVPGSASDPNLVGAVTPITAEQSQEIAKSACNAWAIEPESSPTKLVLLVDVSSSMNSAAPGGNRSKWEITRDALVEAVCGVTGPGLSGNTAVGLMFYPNMVNNNVSTTPVAQSVCLNTGGITPMDTLGNNDPGTQRTVLRSALTQVTLGRGTPTADAYSYTLENLALSEAQQKFPGETYILLITDGMPTLQLGCFNTAGRLDNLPGDEVVALVDQAFGRGVKTFIIGSPGSEDGVAWLSRAAFLGGTAKADCNPDNARGPFCHMDMTTAPDFSAALRDGLNQVVQSISGCKFDVPTESADGTKQVDLNAISPIIRFADGHSEIASRDNKNGADCKEGYHLVSTTQMELCQDTCARFSADSKATMQIIFGCSDDKLKDILQ